MLHAQEKDNYYIREWKSYYEDSISFEYLKLTAKGDGVRAFGQTINGKDTLFLDRGIKIVNWLVTADTLFVMAEIMPGRPYYRYTINKKENNHFEAIEENDLLRIYDKNKKNLKKLNFKVADNANANANVRVSIAQCIYEMDLFAFQEIDAVYKLVKKKAIENIIDHILNCKAGFQYVTTYKDKPFKLTIPKYLGKYSFGSGDNNFYISFDDFAGVLDRSIVVYYDFKNEHKEFFLRK